MLFNDYALKVEGVKALSGNPQTLPHSLQGSKTIFAILTGRMHIGMLTFDNNFIGISPGPG